MHKVKNWIVRHPEGSGGVIYLLFILFSVLAWPITRISLYPEGFALGDALAKIVLAVGFLLLPGALGWLRPAGLGSLGGRRAWKWTLILLIIKVPLTVYAFTGEFFPEIPALGLAGYVALFTFSTAFLEEIMFRGLLLSAAVRAWGVDRAGLLRAALLSGIFFGGLHLVNLLARSPGVVLLQVTATVLSGYGYALLVLLGRSIWPAILLHWMTNLWVSLQIVQRTGFEETSGAWGIELAASAVSILMLLYWFRSSEPLLFAAAVNQALESS